MKSRIAVALPAALPAALTGALIALALCAPATRAQARGAGGGRAVSGARSAARSGSRSGSLRGRGGAAGNRGYGQYRNGNGLLYPGLFYPYDYAYDDLDSGAYGPGDYAPVQYIPVQAPAPAAPAADALVLENRAGQWVRVPNGKQVPTASPSTGKSDAKPDQTQPAGKEHPGIVDPAAGMKPAANLPTAVIVYRDGHKEELQKYMIQGDALYTSTNPNNSGALTKRIPLSQLDIPASLKLNQDRGAKFNLPAASNEVVIRF